MREIKFRCWNKATKQMVSWEENVKNSFLIRLDLPEMILMQFTGQTDENEKEIFEGDIVLFKCNEDYTEETKGVVVYNEEECCFEIKGYVNFTSDGAEIDTIEVIGNIHENPELLEESK